MVEESELVNRLRDILRKSDLNTTSAGAVRRQLESDFGVDLSDRKKFISQLIDDIIQGEQEEVKEEEEEDEGEGEGEGEDEDRVREEVREEEDDEDEATKSPRSNSLEETPKKKRGGGFTKICSLSPPLQDFLQVSEMARTEVVKKLWAYIRENNLQDPSNRRNIKCDDKLRSIFRVDKINMFQMNKVLSKHIWPLQTDTDTPPPPPNKKQKRPIQDNHTDVKPKPQKGGTSGFLMPLHLSEAFVKFLGTGETTLSRAEAVKRIWGYIKLNDLQDPSDKRQILCDEKLKELFEVDTFHGFSMAKYLKAHLSKVEQ
ncbi:hypothetical protein KSS87_011828 [Heliosperma pusillum]|nr:hypothetical protein KSS87_011828 [Heliosperma pusillum]